MSISSSEPRRSNVPWAGFAAILILLALDSFVFGRLGPHERIVSGVRNGSLLARERLMAASEVEPTRPRVVTVGSSQMDYALTQRSAERLAPDLEFVEAAAAAMNPLSERSIVGPVLTARPALVVIGLSPLDTHSPIRLLQNRDAPDASAAALWRVVAIAGPGFALRERNLLFRLLASNAVGAIRYYAAVQALGPRQWRSFALGDELVKPPLGNTFARVQIGAGPRPFPNSLFERVVETFETGLFAVRGMRQVNDLQDGPHVEIQTALIEDTIAAYQAAGVPVIVVELPIHPIGDLAQDLENRSEFQRILRHMSERDGFEFVSLAEQPLWLGEEFLDVVHLNEAGAERFTALLVELSRRRLAPEDDSGL